MQGPQSKARAIHTIAGRNLPLIRKMGIVMNPVCPLKHLISAFSPETCAIEYCAQQNRYHN